MMRYAVLVTMGLLFLSPFVWGIKGVNSVRAESVAKS